VGQPGGAPTGCCFGGAGGGCGRNAGGVAAGDGSGSEARQWGRGWRGIPVCVRGSGSGGCFGATACCAPGLASAMVHQRVWSGFTVVRGVSLCAGGGCGGVGSGGGVRCASSARCGACPGDACAAGCPLGWCRCLSPAGVTNGSGHGCPSHRCTCRSEHPRRRATSTPRRALGGPPRPVPHRPAARRRVAEHRHVPSRQVSTPSPHVLRRLCTDASCGLGDEGQGPSVWGEEP
jgi:hypothetical protein